jgi:predicted metal-dependent hydrolase
MPYKTFDITDLGMVSIYKRKGNRNIRLTVTSDGTVRVTLPLWAPYQAGVAFVSMRRNWVLAQKKPLLTGLLIDGQQIGKAHHLCFHADPELNEVKSSVRGTTITVTYGTGQDPAHADVQMAAKVACIRALRVQAVELLGKRLQQLATLHDLSYKSLTIKRMKTRWGSCDQHTNVVLNLFLIQLPWSHIDYVILHELAHTKALHHGPAFWATLESMLPNARAMKKAMKAYQPVLAIAQSQAPVA